MGKQCHQADLGRRERRGVSYCPPSCIGGVPGNEGWGEVYWMDILFAHASLRERGREGLHRRGSLGLFLLFLILALACLYFSPPSYWVDNREEQQEESFPSLWYI